MNTRKKWTRRMLSLGLSLSLLVAMGGWNAAITHVNAATADSTWIPAYSNTFDSLSTMSDFDNYYSDNASYSGDAASNGVLTNYGSSLQAWLIKDGTLFKNDQSGDIYDNEHFISALTYKTKTFRNFRLDVDFTWNDQLWCHGSLAVVFGQKVLGNYVNNTAGGGGLAAVITEQTTDDSDKKVTAEFYGTMKDGISTKTSAQTPLDIGTAYTTPHHMTVEVNNGVATIYIDNTAFVSTELPQDYSGYISLVGNKNVDATFDNLVISVPAPAMTTTYSNDFNSADSLSNFDNYYSDDLTSSGDNGVLTNYGSSLQAWLLKDGALYKNDQGGDTYDNDHLISALTYKAKTFHDFRLDVDFTTSDQMWCHGSLMVVFGQATLGQWVNNAAGGGLAAVITEQTTTDTDKKVSAEFYGNMKGGNFTKISTSAQTTIDIGSAFTTKHHMTVEVYKGYATIYIDGVDLVSVDMPSSYTGYISLAGNKDVGATFDNLVIQEPAATDKQALQNEITLAQNAKDAGTIQNLIPSVQQSFASAFITATSVNADDYAIQADADAACQALTAEMQKLDMVKADKSALQTLYDSASQINLGLYPDGAAKTGFSSALQTANTVLGNDNALQTDVNNADTALTQAISALNQSQVDHVITLITALPATVTLNDKTAVEAARTAYNALTDTQKALVTNYSTLTTDETQIAQLTSDKNAADPVKALIASLPATVTLNDKTAVEAARTAYNTLTDAQKALVTNYSTLTADETKIAQLISDQSAADTVKALITALPATVTLNDKTAVEAARTAYNTLTDSQKALVTNYSILTADETTVAQLISDQNAADSVTALITAFPSTITLSDKSAVEAARTAYNKLTAAQKALVANYTNLTDAETVIASLTAESSTQTSSSTQSSAATTPSSGQNPNTGDGQFSTYTMLLLLAALILLTIFGLRKKTLKSK